MKINHLFIFLFFCIGFNQTLLAQQSCSPVAQPTYYRIKKGDHVAAILRKLGLNPVFGNNGSLNNFLKLNNLKNINVISPGNTLRIPFSCEQQVTVWNTSPFEDGRLLQHLSEYTITLKPAPVVINKEVTEKRPDKLPEIITPPLESELKIEPELKTILKTQAQGVDQVLDVEADKKSQDDISEALRYRMICDGEWTGSECISRYTAVYATIGGWNNRYDGVDTRANAGRRRDGLLLSKLNPSVGFGWDNYWNENVRTNLYAELQQSSILPELTNIPIENDKKLLSSLQAEVRYEKGRWGLGLGYRQFDKLYYVFNFQQLFNFGCSIDDVSQCGVIVYSANVPSLFLNISYMIHQSGKFRFDSEFKYFTLGSSQVSNVDIYSGSGQSVEFSVTHDRVKEYLKGSLKYSQSTQDTSIETQNAKEVGLIFTYAWKLKDWSEDTVNSSSERDSTKSKPTEDKPSEDNSSE